MQGFGRRAVARARILGGRFERIELGLAALDAFEPAAHGAHRLGQLVHFAAVLARQRAQFEQPRFGGIERGGVVDQRLGGGLQLFLRLARFDHRAVERAQRFGQQRMFGRDPVEPPCCHAQRCERRVRAFPQMPQFLEIARQLLALLHVRAGCGEPRLFARLRFERGQFGEMREQQILVGLGGFHRAARFGQRLLGAAPFAPRLRDPRGVRPGEPVEQRPVPARIDQPAIVMLAMQFDEEARHVAQQADADRLVVDEGAAFAIGFELAPHDQRFAVLQFDIRIVEQAGKTARQGVEVEGGRNAGLVLAAAHQPAVGAVA